MFGFGAGLTDAEAQGQSACQAGVGEIGLAAEVDPLEDGLVGGLTAAVAEADQIERRREGEFEIGMGLNPAGELLGQCDMAADVVLQSFPAVVAQDEPELEAAEAAAERNLPVAVIDHSARLGRPVAQIFRQNGQGADEGATVADEHAVAVKIGEHPLVRIGAVAVGELQSLLDIAEFGAEGGGAAHRPVDMKPEPVLGGDAADFGEGIEAVGGGGADSGAHKEGEAAGGDISADGGFEFPGAHGGALVDRNEAQVFAADAGDFDRLFD